ncbi:MAG: alpha/beta hydrolase [Alphaproteobacteria bacterium]
MTDNRSVLAPESLAFIHHMEQVPVNPNMSVEDGRKGLESLVALVGGSRVEIPYIEDVLIPSESEAHSFYVRIYHPEVSQKPLPMMLYIHGGGWTRGNLHTHDKLCRVIAERCHIRVVSVDYRLSPENPFPKGLHDALSAYNWCLNNKERLAIDPDRIVISGDSGGGNISAALTCLLKSTGNKLPKMLMLFYPSLDLTGGSPSMENFATGCFLTKEVVEQYTTNYIGPDHTIATDWKISPMFFDDLKGFPTTCVLVCGADPIRDDGIRFEEKLRNAGVSTEFICLDGTLHAFLQLYDCFKPQCERAFSWIEDSLKKLL